MIRLLGIEGNEKTFLFFYIYFRLGGRACEKFSLHSRNSWEILGTRRSTGQTTDLNDFYVLFEFTHNSKIGILTLSEFITISPIVYSIVELGRLNLKNFRVCLFSYFTQLQKYLNVDCLLNRIKMNCATKCPRPMCPRTKSLGCPVHWKMLPLKDAFLTYVTRTCTSCSKGRNIRGLQLGDTPARNNIVPKEGILIYIKNGPSLFRVTLSGLTLIFIYINFSGFSKCSLNI